LEADTMTLKRIKRINSYAGHARYLATVNDHNFTRCIPRRQDIPSPYAYAPEHAVYTDGQGRDVIIVETAHKQYDVFDVSGETIVPVHREGIYSTI